MKPTISVLIATYQRNNLLRWNLTSLFRNMPDGAEVIVLDDDHEQDPECEALAQEFGCRYVHSGRSKPAGGSWRIPGFAFNIGAKLAQGDYIALSCAEAYHLQDTLDLMMMRKDPNKVLIPISVRDDRQGHFLRALDNNLAPPPARRLRGLNAALPFFILVNRALFVKIGGYDEDFTGVCWDDNDIIERLIASGCRTEPVSSHVIHLFHQRLAYQSAEVQRRLAFNKAIYERKHGTIIRNEGRSWGELSASLPGDGTLFGYDERPKEATPEQPENPGAQIRSSMGYNNPHDY